MDDYRRSRSLTWAIFLVSIIALLGGVAIAWHGGAPEVAIWLFIVALIGFATTGA
jgi:fatty acid desaturase